MLSWDAMGSNLGVTRIALAGALLAGCTVVAGLDPLTFDAAQGGGDAVAAGGAGGANGGMNATGGAGGSGGAEPCDLTRVLRVARTTFSTEQDTFQLVETLTLPGGAAPDGWLVFVSARLRSNANGGSGAVLRYLVDGVERGMGEVLISTMDDADGGPFQSFDFVPASGDDRAVAVELRRRSSYTATVDDLRVVALPLPPNAEPVWADTPGARMLTQPMTNRIYLDVEQVQLTPSSPGRYLVMASLSASEEPGTSTVGVRVFAPGPAYWPEASVLTPRPYLAFPQPRPVTMFVARVFDSDGSTADFSLQVDPASNGGSMVYDTRMLVLRLDDAFQASPDVAAYGEAAITATDPVSVIEMEIGDGSCREYAVIQNVAVHGDGPHHVDFVAPAATSFRHSYLSTSSKLAYSAFDAIATADPVSYGVSAGRATSVDEMYTREALILGLAP